jgi:hypothetical protein
MIRTPQGKRHGGFLIAHRAGNDLQLLREATSLGAGLIE